MKVKKAFWIFTILTVLTMISDRILFIIFPNYLLENQFSATEIGSFIFYSSSIIQFFLSLLIVSIGFYIYRIAFKTVLMDTTIKKARGEQMGLAKNLQGVGDMIGPVLGGFLIVFISLSSAFFVAGFIGLLAAFLAYRIK